MSDPACHQPNLETECPSGSGNTRVARAMSESRLGHPSARPSLSQLDELSSRINPSGSDNARVMPERRLLGSLPDSEPTRTKSDFSSPTTMIRSDIPPLIISWALRGGRWICRQTKSFLFLCNHLILIILSACWTASPGSYVSFLFVFVLFCFV